MTEYVQRNKYIYFLYLYGVDVRVSDTCIQNKLHINWLGRYINIRPNFSCAVIALTIKEELERTIVVFVLYGNVARRVSAQREHLIRTCPLPSPGVLAYIPTRVCFDRPTFLYVLSFFYNNFRLATFGLGEFKRANLFPLVDSNRVLCEKFLDRPQFKNTLSPLKLSRDASAQLFVLHSCSTKW